MYHFNDLSGARFNRLLVIEKSGRSTDRHILWLCKCDCGNETIVTSRDLTSGHTQSCGCYNKEMTSKAKTKHGGRGNHKNTERLYRIWADMRRRCNSKELKSYKYYGGLGVKVCNEWENYSSFRSWALGKGYQEKAPKGECTIDRINPYGNYSPDNCRWATVAEQNRNQRRHYKGGEDHAD